MNEQNRSRIRRFEKRRKNTKWISILFILIVILLFVFLWNIIFGGNDQETEESVDTHLNIEEKQNNEQSEEEQANSDDSKTNNEQELTEEDNERSLEGENDETSNESLNTEQVEPSDENVIEAYTANWPAISTEQTEPDIMNFDKETQNRAEMESAIRSATGLNDNMVVWWLSNGGSNQVIGTVSDREETDIYRVHIQWNDGQGWQPFKVERLKENDQKWRFE